MKLQLVFSIVFLSLVNVKAQDKTIEFVKLKNTRFESVNTSNIEITTEAVIYNPLKLKAEIKELQIDVFIDKHKIGTITEVENITIRKQQTTHIPLHLRAKTGNVLKSIFFQGSKLLTGKVVSIEYKGIIKLKGLAGMAPINIKVDSKEHLKISEIAQKK